MTSLSIRFFLVALALANNFVSALLKLTSKIPIARAIHKIRSATSSTELNAHELIIWDCDGVLVDRYAMCGIVWPEFVILIRRVTFQRGFVETRRGRGS